MCSLAMILSYGKTDIGDSLLHESEQTIGPLQLVITWYKNTLLESKVAPLTSKTKRLNLHFLCLVCPSAQFALQQGVFVPCDR